MSIPLADLSVSATAAKDHDATGFEMAEVALHEAEEAVLEDMTQDLTSGTGRQGVDGGSQSLTLVRDAGSHDEATRDSRPKQPPLIPKTHSAEKPLSSKTWKDSTTKGNLGRGGGTGLNAKKQSEGSENTSNSSYSSNCSSNNNSNNGSHVRKGKGPAWEADKLNTQGSPRRGAGYARGLPALNWMSWMKSSLSGKVQGSPKRASSVGRSAQGPLLSCDRAQSPEVISAAGRGDGPTLEKVGRRSTGTDLRGKSSGKEYVPAPAKEALHQKTAKQRKLAKSASHNLDRNLQQPSDRGSPLGQNAAHEDSPPLVKPNLPLALASRATQPAEATTPMVTSAAETRSRVAEPTVDSSCHVSNPAGSSGESEKGSSKKVGAAARFRAGLLGSPLEKAHSGGIPTDIGIPTDSGTTIGGACGGRGSRPASAGQQRPSRRRSASVERCEGELRRLKGTPEPLNLDKLKVDRMRSARELGSSDGGGTSMHSGDEGAPARKELLHSLSAARQQLSTDDRIKLWNLEQELKKQNQGKSPLGRARGVPPVRSLLVSPLSSAPGASALLCPLSQALPSAAGGAPRQPGGGVAMGRLTPSEKVALLRFPLSQSFREGMPLHGVEEAHGDLGGSGDCSGPSSEEEDTVAELATKERPHGQKNVSEEELESMIHRLEGKIQRLMQKREHYEDKLERAQQKEKHRKEKVAGPIQQWLQPPPSFT